jgi:hypothetical protein
MWDAVCEVSEVEEWMGGCRTQATTVRDERAACDAAVLARAEPLLIDKAAT